VKSLKAIDDDKIDIDIESLITFIFKTLKSQIPVLKNIALGCIYWITKLIVSNSFDNDKLLTIFKSQLVNNVKEFVVKKNSKIPRKLFEEILSRYSEFSIDLIYCTLVEGCGSDNKDIKNDFLKIECCELLLPIFKRFKTLSVTSKLFIQEQNNLLISKLVSSVLHFQLLLSNSEKDFNISVPLKRLKTLLSVIKDVFAIVDHNDLNNINILKDSSTGILQFYEEKWENFSESNQKVLANQSHSIKAIIKNILEKK
jgi:hypothetical protein